MAEERRLARKTPEERAARRQERLERIKHMMDDVLFNELRTASLRKLVFETDEQLQEWGYSAKQIRMIREFEKPRSETAFAMQANHETINSMMRRESDKPRLTVNVERAVIKLPDQQELDEAPIVIDVEPEK